MIPAVSSKPADNFRAKEMLSRVTPLLGGM
jgi:hypothetical protein